MKKSISMSICLLAVIPIYAADIVIAPPPMGYSPLEEIGEKMNVRVNYMKFDVDSFTNTGYGVGMGYRKKETEKTVHNMALDYLVSTGSSSSGSVSSETETLNFSYQYGYRINEKLLGYLGGTFNYTTSSIEMPSSSAFYPTTTINSSTKIYSALGGAQYEHDVEFGTLIPWAALTYVIGGTSDIGTTSTTVDAFTAYQLGFDIYFKAIYTSLSSMYQSSSDGDLLSLNLNYSF